MEAAINFPAQYATVAADEMVYLCGGSAASELISSADKLFNWLYAIEYPLRAVYNLAKSYQYINGDKDITGPASLGTAVSVFGAVFYYGGLGLRYISTVLNLG